MLRRAVIALAALCLLAAPALAQSPAPPPSYPAIPLIATSTTIVGETIEYPKGDAHVTAAIVTLAPGARTIMHTHGVPMFAHILDGEITVDYGTHGKRTYRKGQSLMEAMHVAHFGENTGSEPMRLIAVYMGSNAAKDVIPVK
ncbi:MAG: cupin domain-containing protein [Pseudolabrys sp.]|nr:cupin domain-containing protein [Pseudolabrys sp.]MDP2298209.1 cupin domain-containing protein [Pseudolabrys sp.]